MEQFARLFTLSPHKIKINTLTVEREAYVKQTKFKKIKIT